MKYTGGAAEPDRDLIQRCRQGSTGAWNQVLNRYERLVYLDPFEVRFIPR